MIKSGAVNSLDPASCYTELILTLFLTVINNCNPYPHQTLADLGQNNTVAYTTQQILHNSSEPSSKSISETPEPSNSRLGSFSSSVRSSRAAVRILVNTYFTLHTSRLLRRPNSPISLSSWSKRSFSKGRRGVE